MHLIVTKDYDALSVEAARQIALAAAAKPTAAAVVATGNTPVGAYRQLVDLQSQGQFNPSQLKIFQLDEYLGLEPSDKRTLWGWMERMFLTPLSIPSTNVVRLDSASADPDATCKSYDDAVADAGGFDIAVLGLGPNGHIAFNEPPCTVDAETRVITLSEESLQSNTAYWGSRDLVPPRAMTAGLRQLLAAKLVILLVSGRGKREILKQVMTGPVTDLVPASHLQLHANVIVIADEEAAA